MEAAQRTEVPQRIKDSLADLKDLLKREYDMERLEMDPDYDPFYIPGYEETSDVFSKYYYAVESEKIVLKAQGRRHETMTKDDWYSHLRNVAPLLLDYLKIFYWKRIRSELPNPDWKGVTVMDNVKKIGPRKQFKLHAKEILNKCHCCVHLAFDIGLALLPKYKLPYMMALAAIVLVIELIVDSSICCYSVQKMKTWVLEKIDDRCDKFFEEYGVPDYYVGLRTILL